MATFARGLHRRLFSSVGAVIPLVPACLSYAEDRNAWRILCIVGALALAVAWFLRPGVPVWDPYERDRRNAELALITKGQWLLLAGGGFLIAVVGYLGTLRGAA